MCAIVGLKIVAIAAIIPVTIPIIAKPDNAGSAQVIEALMINSNSANPVLFTTPFTVITSPAVAELESAFLNVSD